MAEEIDLDDPRAFKDPAADPESVVVSGLAAPLKPEEIPNIWRHKTKQVPETDAHDPYGIILNPNVDPKVFDDLLQPPSPTTAAEARQRQHDFGLLKADDFGTNGAYFNQAALPITEGVFPFRVEQSRLQAALETTELTVSKRAPFDKVKVTLFRSRLSLQTFNQASFAEVMVPLLEASPSLPAERDKEPLVTYVFDHKLLLRIVRRLPEELSVVTFTYMPQTQTLSFQTWENPKSPTLVQKDFRLTCWDRKDFTDFRADDRLALGRINSTVLRQAVSYVRLFARQDDTRSHMNLIELRDGVMYGGTAVNMGALDATALQVLDLRVKFESVKTLEQMLARLNKDDTTVFETDRYMLLTDETLFFGFERYAFSFPLVAEFFHQKTDNFCLVERDKLRASLTLLGAVSKDPDLLVEVSLTGGGSEVRLDLVTRERTGRPCRDFVRGSRQFKDSQTSDFPDWHFSVNLKVWLDVVCHFEHTHVHLEVFNNRALHVYDGAGPLTARSLLSFLTQEDVNRLKEHTAFTATAGRRSSLRFTN